MNSAGGDITDDIDVNPFYTVIDEIKILFQTFVCNMEVII